MCVLLPGLLFSQESLSLMLVTSGDEQVMNEYYDLSVDIFSELLLEQGIVASEYPDLDSGMSDSTLLDIARRDAMVFLAVNRLDVDGDSISIQTEFIYTPDGENLFQTQASGSLSLGLERKLEFIAAQASEVVAGEIEARSREAVTEDQRVLEAERVDEITALPESRSDDAPEQVPEDQYNPEYGGPEEASDNDPSGGSEPLEDEDQRTPRFNSFSLDIGAASFLPLARYSEYVDYNVGGRIRFSMALYQLPLEFGISLGGTWMHSSNPYTDIIGRIHLLAEAGYRFRLGKSSWSLMPRLSGGLLIHLASGAFNSLSDITSKAYADQYYGLSLEASFAPWMAGNPESRLGFYVTTGYFIYPNKDYVGMVLDLELGLRIRVGKLHTSDTGTSGNPAVSDK